MAVVRVEVGGRSVGAALRGGNVEVAFDGVRGGAFAADAEFFFEPVHQFGPFHRPDHDDLGGECFVVPHAFDQVEELAGEGGDAAAAGEEDDGVERGHLTSHAAIGAVDVGAVGLVGSFSYCCVVDLAGEAGEGTEDECHVPILIAIF